MSDWELEKKEADRPFKKKDEEKRNFTDKEEVGYKTRGGH